jgi:hypothetical protein
MCSTSTGALSHQNPQSSFSNSRVPRTLPIVSSSGRTVMVQPCPFTQFLAEQMLSPLPPATTLLTRLGNTLSPPKAALSTPTTSSSLLSQLTLAAMEEGEVEESPALSLMVLATQPTVMAVSLSAPVPTLSHPPPFTLAQQHFESIPNQFW